ncbi:PaaI family thioesterase [Salaquimonas pukyongi]|uniref:PaaI family thioesterase n=1 Tax=Salaquimonas pukyongi TaxID=2712698 RepID=UPI00096B979E|nr:PaaI family thioesterase [Salaquimonas pukyongi]
MNTTPAETWFAFAPVEENSCWKVAFQEHHLGNPLIRSIHGGVVGSLIEHTAEKTLDHELAHKGRRAKLELTTSSIDYLRVTKDSDLYARGSVMRIARRVAFMDVVCWQDSEDLPVARGACTLRILEE